MVDHDDSQKACIFHAGEIALQQDAGLAERMAHVGPPVIRGHMPLQHREFFGQLPFLLAATVDDRGDVWPTMLCGHPGFIRSPSPTSLTIRARPFRGDPAGPGLEEGKAIALLGIEPHSRRRNRMNGTIRSIDAGAIEIEVVHSFGNCPKYIRPRQFAFTRQPEARPKLEPEILDLMDDAARGLIAAADTFFVASYADRDEGRQVDVSHRGGASGFVRMEPDGELTIPDYSGNFFFNTLGNFILNQRAGLLFVDFGRGDLLHLAGKAQVITRSSRIAEFEGAQRIWKFRPERMIRRRGALPLSAVS